jgi:hypothetical protein
MTEPPSTLRRPPSYSESDIRLPRVASNLAPLVESPIPSPPRRAKRVPTLVKAHRWALRFSLHITLISLFETLFFWHFVSVTEDLALYGLVDDYTIGVFRGCSALTAQQRAALLSVVDFFINTTRVDGAGLAAAQQRSAFNTALLRQSWGYVGGFAAFTVALGAGAVGRRVEIHWRNIAAENLCLVVLLGLYEYMFFRTVVFPYKSVSIPELDSHVVDEFQNAC